MTDGTGDSQVSPDHSGGPDPDETASPEAGASAGPSPGVSPEKGDEPEEKTPGKKPEPAPAPPPAELPKTPPTPVPKPAQPAPPPKPRGPLHRGYAFGTIVFLILWVIPTGTVESPAGFIYRAYALMDLPVWSFLALSLICLAAARYEGIRPRMGRIFPLAGLVYIVIVYIAGTIVSQDAVYSFWLGTSVGRGNYVKYVLDGLVIHLSVAITLVFFGAVNLLLKKFQGPKS